MHSLKFPDDLYRFFHMRIVNEVIMPDGVRHEMCEWLEDATECGEMLILADPTEGFCYLIDGRISPFFETPWEASEHAFRNHNKEIH